MFLEMLFVAAVQMEPGQQKQLVDQIALSREELFPPQLYLVKAEALTAKRLSIIHVYVGPRELRGRTFGGEFDNPITRDTLLRIPHNFFPGRNMSTRTPLVPGDVGLFWLREDKKAGELRFELRNVRPSPVGFVVKGYKYFSREVGLADALSAVYQETDQGRWRRLDSYVRSGDTGKGIAALRQLTWNSKNAKIVDYLLELSREASLPISVQIDIHDALRERKKDWPGSEAELQIVGRWFTDPWKESDRPIDFPKNPWFNTDESTLVRWMRLALIDDLYTGAQQAELAINGLANPQRTEKFKEELLGLLGNMRPFLSKTNGDSFAYAAKKATSAPKLAEKAAAVKLLATFGSLDEAQRLKLRALLAGQTDEQIRHEIQSILRDDK